MMNESNSVRSGDSLVIHAKFIIPIVPKGVVLEEHSLVISGGAIVDLCPSDKAKANYPGYDALDLSSHALIPGLINAHGHSAMSLFRGIANDLSLMDWLNDHIWPAESQWVKEDFVRDGTQLAIAEMLKCGTTTFSDMYFFPNIAAEVATETGIRSQFVCPVLDFPTVWAQGPDEYLEKALELSIQYSENPLVNIGIGPHAPYTVSDAPLENIKALLDEYDLPVQIHLHETQFEVSDAQEKTGKRPIARLRDLGLLDHDIPLQCVHMTALNDEDIEIIANSNASVVHCPESNLKLASGFCPVQTLIDRGVTVALGTDGAASNNDLDMIGEMRTAALLAKAVAQDASALDAPSALHMATLGGAEALGLADIVGSLEVGKRADIVAIDLDQLNSQPSFDPIADIVYSVASNQVSDVWVDGRQLLANKVLTEMDEAAIIDNAKQWRNKIKQI